MTTQSSCAKNVEYNTRFDNLPLSYFRSLTMKHLKYQSRIAVILIGLLWCNHSIAQHSVKTVISQTYAGSGVNLLYGYSIGSEKNFMAGYIGPAFITGQDALRPGISLTLDFHPDGGGGKFFFRYDRYSFKNRFDHKMSINQVYAGNGYQWEFGDHFSIGSELGIGYYSEEQRGTAPYYLISGITYCASAVIGYRF